MGVMFSMANYRDPRIRVVQDLMDRYGLSSRWLALKLQTSHTNINNWLSGDKHPRDRSVYDQMLAVLKDEGPKEAGITPRVTGMRVIPVYGGLHAGPKNSYHGDVEEEMIPDWGTGNEVWGRRIVGESMEPVLISGDIAVFEELPCEPGDVCHFYADGEDLVKAARGHGENRQLCSFNEEYPPIPANGWKSKGVCVGRIRIGPFGVKSYTRFPNKLTWTMRTMTF